MIYCFITMIYFTSTNYIEIALLFILAVFFIIISRKGTFGQILKVKTSVYHISLIESIIFFWRTITKPKKDSQDFSLNIFQKFLATNKTALFSFPVPMVMTGDHYVIKEIQNSEIWADRPIGCIFSQRSIGKTRGILVNNGTSWKALRKYTMKKLYQLGFGKKDCMTSFLEEELGSLISHVEYLQKTENKIAIYDLFSLSVLNIVWRITTSEKFARDDPHYNAILKNTTTITTFPVAKILLYEFKPLQPIINYFPHIFGYSEFFESLQNLREYFKRIIKRREEANDNGESHDDFIDSFLKEIEVKERNDDLNGIFSTEELVTILTDLFQAGMDTTSSTLEGAFMFMIKFPKVQERIQQEIDNVVEQSRYPSYFRDRHRMPYTLASIAEIHRMASIGIFNARAAQKDCSLGNANIKKGTIGFLQLHYVRMDKQFWMDPEEFRPERFLSQENELITENVNRIMAFGGGVRACPGEIVATSTIFTFLTGLLQRYSFSKVNDKLQMRNSASLTNRVIPFSMYVTLRK